MLERFRNWLRVVCLPEPFILAAVFVTLSVLLIEWLSHWCVIWFAELTAPQLSESEVYAPDIKPIHLAVVYLLALAYGVHRGSGFHPVADKSYGTWLAQTPWRFPTPLPFGPVHLVWQDAAIVAMLMILALLPPQADVSVLYLPTLFLVAYSVGVVVTLFALGIYWVVGGMIILAGSGVLVFANPWLCLLAALAMYGITYLGVASSLRDFPYTEEERIRLGLVPFELQSPPDVALPIAPKDEVSLWFRVGPAQAIVGGFLAGLLLFCGGFHFRGEEGFLGGMLFVHLCAAGIAIVARVIGYTMGHHPPISLFGRIATRRLIIPEYDKVFVAPLVAAVAGLLTPANLLWIGIAPIAAIPISTGIVVSLAFGLRPRFKEWYYTGHYRIPAVRRIGKEFVEA